MESLNNNKKYKIHPKDEDIRNWDFIVNEKKVGKVEDLMINKVSGKVNYLNVVNHSEAASETYHFLVPINKVLFDHYSGNVIMISGTGRFFEHYPRFRQHAPDDYETELRDYFKTEEENGFHPDSKIKHRQKLHLEEIRIHDGNELHYENDDDILIRSDGFSDHNQSNDHHDLSWDQKVKKLEKMKKIKMIELERDIAIIEKEIELLKAKKMPPAEFSS